MNKVNLAGNPSYKQKEAPNKGIQKNLLEFEDTFKLTLLFLSALSVACSIIIRPRFSVDTWCVTLLSSVPSMLAIASLPIVDAKSKQENKHLFKHYAILFFVLACLIITTLLLAFILPSQLIDTKIAAAISIFSSDAFISGLFICVHREIRAHLLFPE